jgi:hypothetical protein
MAMLIVLILSGVHAADNNDVFVVYFSNHAGTGIELHLKFFSLSKKMRTWERTCALRRI